MVFNLNNFIQKGSGSDNMNLLYGIIIVIVFYVFIMPVIEKSYNNEKKDLVEKLENIMDGKLDTNKCSRSCCINSGWELPKELQPTDMSVDELKNYIPSNFSCNFGSNTESGGGCVCVTKNAYESLGSRGGNGVSGCNI
jgi:hypothetical protein